MELTTFTASYSVNKKYYLDESKQLAKQSATPIGKDSKQISVQVHSFSDMQTLCSFLDTLPASQAVVYGVPKNEQNKNERLSKNYEYPQDALWMLDYDPQNQTPLTKYQFLDILFSVMPEIGSCGYILRPSGSSYIYNLEAKKYEIANKGLRVLIRVNDGKDIPRIGKFLFKKLWLAGYGYIQIAQSGAQLERTLIDACVWQTNRLDYCAGATCIHPLTRIVPKEETIIHEGNALDVTLIYELSQAENIEYERLVEIEKEKTKEQSKEQKKKHTNTLTAKQIKEIEHKENRKATKEEREKIKKTVQKSLENSELTLDSILYYDGGSTTIKDILAEKQKWHLHGFYDPLEPDYSDREIAIAYLCQKKPVVYSQAHGGKSYFLPKKKNEIEWIYENEKGKKVVITSCLARSYSEEKENLVYCNENFYDYNINTGLWDIVNMAQVKSDIRNKIISVEESLSKKYTIEDVYSQVFLICFSRGATITFDQNHNNLNFINGVLDLPTMGLKPFQKEYYHTIKLPLNFSRDSGQECKKWHAYLNSLELSLETIKRLQEWAGYCFYPQVKIQKCLYLKGSGDNGKSIFLNTIAAMLGKACGRLEITEIYERFRSCDLQGKFANICADIRTDCLDNKFKEIIDGNPIIGEQKFKSHFTFQPFAKFLFSANNFLPTKDRSHGFFKRFDVVEFKKKFSKDEINPNLQDELLKELSAIFLWAMDGLDRLKHNNWKLTESTEFDETKKQFQEDVNPIVTFIDEKCDKESHISKIENLDLQTKERVIDRFAKDSVYEAYKDFCKSGGFLPLNKVHFCREMHSLGYEDGRYGVNKKRVFLNCSVK